MITLRAIVAAVLITVCFTIPGRGVAQGSPTYPLVQTSVDPTSGTVGDKFNLTITATVPDVAGLDVLPLFETQTSWTLVGSTDGDVSEASGGNDSKTFNYTIVPFETGRLAVPQVAYTYKPADGSASSTVLSEPLWVDIDSVIASGGTGTNLREVKPPVPVPLPRAVVYSGGLLLLVIIGVIAWLIWRRYSERLKRMLGGPLRPDEKALKQFAQLEDDRLIEQKKIKEFYTRLSDSVREYLASAYGVDAVDLTSNEMLRALDELAPGQPHKYSNDYKHAIARLAELLDEADLVRFARLIPDTSHCRRALQSGRDIVGLTRYRFEPVEEPASPNSQGTRTGTRSSTPPPPPAHGPHQVTGSGGN